MAAVMACDEAVMGTEALNLFDIPPSALRPPTQAALSCMLNPPKVLSTDDGLPRDWRGLVHLTALPVHLRPHASHADPTSALLAAWREGSLGQLLECLQHMDRWDVVQDTQSMMEADAVAYLQSKERASSSADALSNEVENQILTRDDVLRLEQGLPPQRYNAYLLYADADEEFALRIIEEMEQKHDLKLCVRDRDLVGGHMFQHEAIMRLISQRCNRLVVVISQDFLQSEANKFFCTFAQALGIDQKRRMVIPVMHRPCRLPPELNFFFVLDYTRSGHLWDFWKKLRDSIEAPAPREERPIQVRIPSSSSYQMSLVHSSSLPSPSSSLKEHSSPFSSGATLHKAKEAEKAGSEQEDSEACIHQGVVPSKEGAGSLKKSSRSMSLESLKARSKKFFSFPQRHKKSKKAAAQPVMC